MKTLFNRYDLIRLVPLLLGIAYIYNTIGQTCGVEQVIINLASLQ